MNDTVMISGAWRDGPENIKTDVTETLTGSTHNHIIVGGAPGVDLAAIETTLAQIENGQNTELTIVLAVDIENHLEYWKHNQENLPEGTWERLFIALHTAHELNIIKVLGLGGITAETSKTCNQYMVEHAHKLYAFWLDDSDLTRDAIERAHRNGLGVRYYTTNP
jgi:hypothetical protein